MAIIKFITKGKNRRVYK